MNNLRTPAAPAVGARPRGLTARRREVLAPIRKAVMNRQIARRLHLSEETVKNRVSRLLAKLGVEHRIQAAAPAARFPRYVFRGPAMGPLASGPGMTVSPLSNG
jgi:DNA-binding NarL/FixJ family response regulator